TLGIAQEVDDVLLSLGKWLRCASDCLSLPETTGQALRNQERDVGISAFGRHCDVRQQASLINECQPFGTLLCDQPSRVTQANGHGSALIDEIGAGFRV